MVESGVFMEWFSNSGLGYRGHFPKYWVSYFITLLVNSGGERELWYFPSAVVGA